MRDTLRLLRLARPYWHWLAAGLGAALATLAANVGLLAVAGWFIAAMALAGAAGVPMNYFTPAALIRTFAIMRSGGRYLERLVTHEATFRLLARLRVWFFEQLEPLAPAFLQQARSGDLLSRIRADIDTLDNLYLRLLVPLAVGALGTLAVVLVLAAYDVRLALVALGGLLVAGGALPLLNLRWGGEPAGRQVTTAAELRTAVVDGVQGMGELAVYGRERDQRERISALSAALIGDQRRLNRLNGLSLGAMGLVANLTLWSGLVLAIPMVGDGRLSGPELAMVALLLLGAFEAVTPLPEAFRLLGATRAAARRLFAVADARPAVAEPPHASPVPHRYDLAFEGLRFRYAPDRPWALDGLSVAIDEGERVALVGPSGAGKSTVVNLLLRFWDYDVGSARLGGHELRSFHAADLRRHIAVVSQHSHIFNTTVRENLLLAAPQADEAALAQACRAAQLDSFIAAQPAGYDTQVGEAGTKLSGGQARRLAIARAMLRDAPILILDEPTEGLDAVTARELMETIDRLMAGRTVLLITQRPADLATMDRIVLLDHGRVVDTGSHHELLARRSGYRRLFEVFGELNFQSSPRAAPAASPTSTDGR